MDVMESRNMDSTGNVTDGADDSIDFACDEIDGAYDETLPVLEKEDKLERISDQFDDFKVDRNPFEVLFGKENNHDSDTNTWHVTFDGSEEKAYSNGRKGADL